MKLTKTQIEKMIMEELQGIDEITRSSRAASSFKGVGAIDNPAYQSGEDPEEMEKIRKRDVQLRQQAAAKKAADKAARAEELSQKDKALQKDYIERMNSRLRKKMNASLTNALSTLYAKVELGKDNGALLDSEFANILRGVVKGGALAGLVADYQNNKGSDADQVFNSFDGKLKKAASEAQYSQIAGTKEFKTAMKAFQSPSGQKPSTGFMGKLKGAFGFEENLKLSKTDLQKIIREELEALQEIGDLSGVERDKDLTARGQKQQAAFDAASSEANELIAAGEPYMMPSSPKFSQNRVMKRAPMTDRQWKDFFKVGLNTVYEITLELTNRAFGEFIDKSLVQAEMLEAKKVIEKYLEAGKGMQTKGDFDKLYNDPRYNRQYLAALSLMLRIANSHFGNPLMMVSSYNGSVMRVDNIEIEKNPEGVPFGPEGRNKKAVTAETEEALRKAFVSRIYEIVRKLVPDYMKHLEKFGSFGFAFDDDEKDAVPKQLAKMGFKESLRRLEMKEKQIIESFDRAAKQSNLSLTTKELQRIIEEELENVTKGN